MNRDALGDRMKAYQNVHRIYLTRRMPLIIRIDGKAFRSYTRNFTQPYDNVLISSMQQTAKYLCENIEGCKLAYTQSDEISLLLTDYKTFNTQPWFSKNLQKMVSVAASMATMAFNQAFTDATFDAANYAYNDELHNTTEDRQKAYAEVMNRYKAKCGMAMFDARAFLLPKEEVCNYFIWRQQDASRNSINMLGRAYFSHKEMNDKNTSQIQDMLIEKYGINWNDIETHKKRGSCVIKETYETKVPMTKVRPKKDSPENWQDIEFIPIAPELDVPTIQRSRWIVDMEIPIFTKDREYIDKYVRGG